MYQQLIAAWHSDSVFLSWMELRCDFWRKSSKITGKHRHWYATERLHARVYLVRVERPHDTQQYTQGMATATTK